MCACVCVYVCVCVCVCVCGCVCMCFFFFFSFSFSVLSDNKIARNTCYMVLVAWVSRAPLVKVTLVASGYGPCSYPVITCNYVKGIIEQKKIELN